MPRVCAQRSIARLVNFGPLSDTHCAGRPRLAISASSSRITRPPDSEVSATRHRLSRVWSSTTDRMRKRRPSIRDQGVVNELHRPALIGPLCCEQRHTHRRCPFAADATADLQARSFFSRRFSSSSDRSRLASEASSPPYLAFQL